MQHREETREENGLAGIFLGDSLTLTILRIYISFSTIESPFLATLIMALWSG